VTKRSCSGGWLHYAAGHSLLCLRDAPIPLRLADRILRESLHKQPHRTTTLTQHPFPMFTMQASRTSQFIRHLVETLDRIFGAVRRIQGFTQILSNHGGKIIKFPSRYLLGTERFGYAAIHPLGGLPMISQKAVDSCGIAVGLEHARTTGAISHRSALRP